MSVEYEINEHFSSNKYVSESLNDYKMNKNKCRQEC